MKNTSLKKSIITIVLLAVVMLVMSLGRVNAASTIPDMSGDLTVGGGTTTTNTTANVAAPTSNTTTNKTTTNSTLNKTQTASNYSSTNLPKTGVTEDYAIIGLIAVCAVSAIYAYIKIRNYKG